MSNFWLQSMKKKQLHKEVDELAMDVWGNDGTLQDLLDQLNDEQAAFFLGMKIKDFGGDPDDLTFGLEVVDN